MGAVFQTEHQSRRYRHGAQQQNEFARRSRPGR